MAIPAALATAIQTTFAAAEAAEERQATTRVTINGIVWKVFVCLKPGRRRLIVAPRE